MVMMMTLLHFKNTFHEVTRFLALAVIVVVVVVGIIAVVVVVMMIHIRTSTSTSSSTSSSIVVVVVAGKIGTVVGRHDHQTGNIFRGGQDTDQDINGTIIGVLYLFQLYDQMVNNRSDGPEECLQDKDESLCGVVLLDGWWWWC